MNNKWVLTPPALMLAIVGMASPAFAQGYIQEFGPSADPRVWQFGPAAGRSRPAEFVVVPHAPYRWYGAPLAGGSIGYNAFMRKDQW